MFQTCLYCHASLGQNPLIEHCPIGQRLAFDPAKGRLWVVCRACERWNLTPFEDRWEALEDCERRYRATRLRYSTANIGLARLEAGVELVRIGEPLRPEMAAWRYGDQFGRRRRRYLWAAGAVVGIGIPAAVLASNALLAAGVSGGLVFNVSQIAYSAYRQNRTAIRLQLPGGEPYKVSLRMLGEVEFLLDEHDRTWFVQLPRREYTPRIPLPRFTGEAGHQVLRQLLPLLNHRGGGAAQVQSAVARLERIPDVEAHLHHLADGPPRRWLGTRALGALPLDARLALEMLLHESFEERSLAGELWRLERAWREAEEVARIADQLLLPEDVEARVERERRKPRFSD